jgi:hypothetical protein
MQSGPS